MQVIIVLDCTCLSLLLISGLVLYSIFFNAIIIYLLFYYKLFFLYVIIAFYYCLRRRGRLTFQDIKSYYTQQREKIFPSAKDIVRFIEENTILLKNNTKGLNPVLETDIYDYGGEIIPTNNNNDMTKENSHIRHILHSDFSNFKLVDSIQLYRSYPLLLIRILFFMGLSDEQPLANTVGNTSSNIYTSSVTYGGSQQKSTQSKRVFDISLLTAVQVCVVSVCMYVCMYVCMCYLCKCV